MGDETGLRPKAGKQREEPPDTDWVRHRQNWAEQTKEGCGWVSRGPTLHFLVSRTVLIDGPAYGFEAVRIPEQQQYCTCLLVCLLSGCTAVAVAAAVGQQSTFAEEKHRRT